MRTKFITAVLITSLSCAAVVWHLVAKTAESPQGMGATFIYLVQTENCIPEHLKSPRAIGNASACQCDVLVLSYKKVCNVTPPAHVEYIFDPTTTWNSGRNLLFQTARQRNEKYLYYTFMDDDINLLAKTEENPWRMYEEFLEQIEPVIGIVDINEQKGLTLTLEGRKQQGCSLQKMPEYLHTIYFDPAFNSFHYQAIDYLLPYPVKFDNISWWFSAWYIMAKVEVMFPRQAVLHTGLLAINRVHRPYPQRLPSQWMFYGILDDIELHLPKMYREVQLLGEWREERRSHPKNSSTLCLPLPLPHMLIEPFSYLKDSKTKKSIA